MCNDVIHQSVHTDPFATDGAGKRLKCLAIAIVDIQALPITQFVPREKCIFVIYHSYLFFDRLYGFGRISTDTYHRYLADKPTCANSHICTIVRFSACTVIFLHTEMFLFLLPFTSVFHYISPLICT
jgi:hypothetical protein